MSHAPVFEAGALFLAVIALALIRLGWGAGGWHWAAGWCCLWASGAARMLGDESRIAEFLYPVLGTAFGFLLFTGACVFSGRTVPRWLVAAAVALGALRAAMTPSVGDAITQVMGASIASAGALAGAWCVLRPKRAGSPAWNLLLAASLPAVALAAWVYADYEISQPGAIQGRLAWLMAGVLVGGIQVVALLGRIAQASEDQRAVLEAVFDSVPVGLTLVRQDGELVAVNRTFEKMLSLEGSARTLRIDQVMERLRRLLEEKDHAQLVDPSDGAETTRQELGFRNGMHVISSTWPVIEPTRGHELGRLWQLVDVTEERQLREGLERARRLETMGGFAGGVAHDFNNQLTSVLGNTALLRDSIGNDPAGNEILDDLESSAQYCANLTQDVLDFARRRPGRQGPIDLSLHLPDVLKRYSNQQPAVDLSVAPELPAILADAISVERVVCNLVDNARAAVGSEGRVEVRAQRAGSDRVQIEVGDDGPGMDDRLRARIFDPFFTTKAVGEGTGLGLAIVYGIVSVQGGEVRVESRPGEGTRMITTWPVT